MPEVKSHHNIISNLTNLSLEELRHKWSEVWEKDPHSRIGRTMLLKSLEYKILEQQRGGFTNEQQNKLEQLIKSYKRNPKFFDENISTLKSGTRLVRNWKGKRYSVLVNDTGYEYKEKIYSSLSQIAFEITGTRWNGWVFFDLKKKETAA